MLLLFDAKHQYLGEMSLSDEGSLKSIFLTTKGEEEIGATVALWQTKGISVKQVVGEATGDDAPFFVERVQPRHAGFKQAFLAWADGANVAVIEVPERLMGFWESLLRLPLSASERFTYLLGICRTSEAKIKEWEELFRKLRYDDAGAESKRALNSLKVKLGKEMKNSLCEISGS